MRHIPRIGKILGLCCVATSFLACITFQFGTSRRPATFQIAFGSCLHQDRPQPIWSSVNHAAPDIFVFMGDNWYAPDGDFSGLVKAADAFRMNPEIIRLRRTASVLATWDDHDYGLNDAGADLPTKEAARKVFKEIFPMPECETNDSQLEGVYRECLFNRDGAMIQFLLLDTRSFRSRLSPDPRQGADPSHYVPNSDQINTMLGEDQWKWLVDRLAKPVDLRVLVSSIQVMPDEHPFEKWGNFPREEQRLLNLLCESPARSTILLSGDRHSAEMSQWACPSGSKLVELTSSSLNVPITDKEHYPNRFRIGPEILEENFGLVTVQTRRKELRGVTGQIRGVHGQILSEIRIIDEKESL